METLAEEKLVDSPTAPEEAEPRSLATCKLMGTAACRTCDGCGPLAGLYVGPEAMAAILAKNKSAKEQLADDTQDIVLAGRKSPQNSAPEDSKATDESSSTKGIVSKQTEEMSVTNASDPEEKPKAVISQESLTLKAPMAASTTEAAKSINVAEIEIAPKANPTHTVDSEQTSAQPQPSPQKVSAPTEVTPPNQAVKPGLETPRIDPEPTTAKTAPVEVASLSSVKEPTIAAQQPKPSAPAPTEKATVSQAAIETQDQLTVEKPAAIDTGESLPTPKVENHDTAPKQIHSPQDSITAPEQKAPDSKADTRPQTVHAEVGVEPTAVFPDELASLREQGEPNLTVANVRRSETAAPTEPHIETTHLDSDATPQPPTPETTQVDEIIDGFVAPADVIDVEAPSIGDEATTVLLNEPNINDTIPSPETDEQTPPIIIEDATPEITEEPLIIDDTNDNEAALTAVGEALELVNLPPEITEEIDVAPLTHEEENDEPPVNDEVLAAVDNEPILNDATEITAAPEPIHERPSAEITASEASDNNEFDPLVASTDGTEATPELQPTINTDEDPPCPYRLVDQEPDDEDDDEINPNQTPLEIVIYNEAVLEPDEEIVVDDSFDITAQQPTRSTGIRSIRHIACRLIGQIAYILAA